MLAMGLITILASCGSGANFDLADEQATTQGETQQGAGGQDGAIGSNGDLNKAFPADLAITSPYSVSKDATTGKALGASQVLTSFSERKAEIDNRLNGTEGSECAFNIDIFKPAMPVNCYGPRIKYYNHPDGGGYGILPIGDTGIWMENNIDENGDTGEACAAAKLNSLVADVASKVDAAIDMFSGMVCMARVEEKDELPERGTSEDLRGSLSVAAEGAGVVVAEAAVKREADDADGNAVYRSKISAALKTGKFARMQINLMHVPLNEENTAYRGKLWYVISDEKGKLAGGTPNCSQGGIRQIAYSITYAKNEEGLLKYDIKSASYCNSQAEPFDADHNVDAIGEWNGNFNLGSYEIDTEKGTGTYSFAWQAGPMDGFARTVVADQECAYFGYGPAVREEEAGTIGGFICNWAGPGSEPFGEKTLLPKVQRQCMTLDEESGKYVSDSARLNIKYAPSLSCDIKDANPDRKFVYYADINDDLVDDIASNDKLKYGGLANELLDITEIGITPPERVKESE